MNPKNYPVFSASTTNLESSTAWRCTYAATTRFHVAHGGQSALQLLKEKGAPAVIVSDMRMPGMDGATLLKHVKQLYPETTRILLTGEPGRDAAISAVNEGQIFRFLDQALPARSTARRHRRRRQPSPAAARRTRTAARNPDRLHQGAGGHTRHHQPGRLWTRHPSEAPGIRFGVEYRQKRVLAARRRGHAVSNRVYLPANRTG